MSDGSACLAQAFDRHIEVAQRTRSSVAAPFARLAAATADTLRAGGKLLLFGNGGSAADAQHIAAELVGRFRGERRALAAIALTTDTSALTAIGNDYGFEAVFARQIEGLGRPGDLAIGFSTSGRSRNVVAGLRAARAGGLGAAALSGGDGGELPDLADPLLLVPDADTPRIQEMHILLGHALCEAVEAMLAKAP
ncbi:MAG: SIS domain-containing protein [Alphaproteobacteria bacterium]